jgi:hypothetical protein
MVVVSQADAASEMEARCLEEQFRTRNRHGSSWVKE